MKTRTLAAIALTVLAFVATGCGGPSEEQKQAAAEARKEADQARSDADAATKLADDCDRQLGDYIETLSDLDSRLGVGMNFEAYSTKVGDVQVSYDRLPFNRMNIECTMGPGLPAENAGQAYAQAYDQWNDCFSDLDCDMDAIEPDLQAKWSRATRNLDDARTAMSELKAEAEDAEAAAEAAGEKADEAEAELEQ